LQQWSEEGHLENEELLSEIEKKLSEQRSEAKNPALPLAFLIGIPILSAGAAVLATIGYFANYIQTDIVSVRDDVRSIRETDLPALNSHIQTSLEANAKAFTAQIDGIFEKVDGLDSTIEADTVNNAIASVEATASGIMPLQTEVAKIGGELKTMSGVNDAVIRTAGQKSDAAQTALEEMHTVATETRQAISVAQERDVERELAMAALHRDMCQEQALSKSLPITQAGLLSAYGFNEDALSAHINILKDVPPSVVHYSEACNQRYVITPPQTTLADSVKRTLEDLKLKLSATSLEQPIALLRRVQNRNNED